MPPVPSLKRRSGKSLLTTDRLAVGMLLFLAILFIHEVFFHSNGKGGAASTGTATQEPRKGPAFNDAQFPTKTKPKRVVKSTDAPTEASPHEEEETERPQRRGVKKVTRRPAVVVEHVEEADPTPQPAPVHYNGEHEPVDEKDRVDLECALSTERDVKLKKKLKIHNRRSLFGTPCVDRIEPLTPFMPFKDVDVKCQLNRRRWFTVQEQLGHVDYIDIRSRQRQAKKLYATCRPPASLDPMLIYIDLGSKDYMNSVRWFRQNYPNGKNFIVHAFDPDVRYLKDPHYADPAQHIFFHHQFIWNETGFVTLIKDQPVPPAGETVDPMQAILDDRPQKLIFHRMEHELAKEDIPAHVPEENLQTLPAISIVDLLATEVNVQEKDFVVVRMDVNGNERMLLELLVVRGMMHFIDELFLVCHNVEMEPVWPVETATPKGCQELIMTLREAGVYVHEWYGY